MSSSPAPSRSRSHIGYTTTTVQYADNYNDTYIAGRTH